MNHNRPTEDLLDELLLLPNDERSSYLACLRNEDPKLGEKLRKLLAASENAGTFLDLDEDSSECNLPANIGPYRIREKIGEGGMGVVYVAEQTQPVQRKVALKIIKPGMDTKEVIARFEAERQALAFMEHPNIARVLDAGATESGRSYFVMELVRGIPITEYCDQVRATPRERLELFQTVCDAVQHAHQKGIIHRDIKPSNVLVTQVSAKPVVKVIDFGLAKAVSGQRLTEKTLYTGFMKLMGTPAYMSPEQASLSGLDVDTRSDIYSLGVLLYELLTGTTPLDKTEIQKQAYDELCRQIREVDAPKPSTRFSTMRDAQRSTVAEQRQIEPRELRQLLDGDLDLVVLKAIDKDRDRRYASPQDLAADIDRFLDDKPVLAVPLSQWYLARKYIRRNRAAILTSAVILSLLLAATVLSTWQAIQVTEANRIAEERKEAAIELADQMSDAKQIADSARQAAIESRNEAKQTAEQRRRLLYASNMQLANQLMESGRGTPAQIQRLLVNWIPSDGQEDLRDFAWRYHWTQLHFSADQTVLGTRAVTISPNGSLVVANQNGIHVWDEESRSLATRWEGDASAGDEQVAFSSCGRWAAIRENDTATVQLIEIASGKVRESLAGTRARFATGGDHVLCWYKDDEGKESFDYSMCDLSKGTCREIDNLRLESESVGSISSDGQSMLFGTQRLDAHMTQRLTAILSGRKGQSSWWINEALRSTAWAPNGKLFASGHFAGDVHLRRADAPNESILIKTGRKFVTAIAFSNDSQTLAVGGWDGTIDLYDVSLATANVLSDRSIEPSKTDSWNAHVHRINAIVFSEDDASIATRDSSGVAHLWRLGNRSNKHPTIEPEGFLPYFVSLGLAITDAPDGSVEITRVDRDHVDIVDGEVREGDRILAVTDAERLQVVDEVVDAVNVREMTHEAQNLVTLHLADESAVGHRVVTIRQKPYARRPTYNALAFSKDGSKIFVSTYGVFARTISGQVIREYPALMSQSVAVSPDGKLLAFDAIEDLILWDLQDDEQYARLDASLDVHPTPLEAVRGTVAFSPDGKYVAMATGNSGNAALQLRSALRVWDVSSRQEICQPLFEHERVLSCIAFSPDGCFLVGTDHTGTVRVWKTSNWEIEDELDGLKNSLTLAFSPNGDSLVQGGYNGIVIWDFESRQTRTVIRQASAKDLGFPHARDGRTFVAVGIGGLATVWDVDTGLQISAIRLDKSRLIGCEFSSTDNRLAVLGNWGNVWFLNAKGLDEIDRHPATLDALSALGDDQLQDRQFDDAVATLQYLLQMQQRAFPPEHEDLVTTRKRLKLALSQQSKLHPRHADPPNAGES